MCRFTWSDLREIVGNILLAEGTLSRKSQINLARISYNCSMFISFSIAFQVFVNILSQNNGMLSMGPVVNTKKFISNSVCIKEQNPQMRERKVAPVDDTNAVS